MVSMPLASPCRRRFRQHAFVRPTLTAYLGQKLYLLCPEPVPVKPRLAAGDRVARVTIEVALRWLLDPGASRGVVVALLRVALGIEFVQAGGGKFLNHDTYVERFRRWELPEPSAFSYAVGALEVTAGLLLVAGLLVRPAALLLAGNMVGAVSTAGRIDGGQDLVLPPILFVTLVIVALAGGGRWQVARRLGLAARLWPARPG
jgi:putative oxidoreductase